MEKSPQKIPGQFEKVSFYVVAHADDWQLFMHPNVYADLVDPGCKVILIIATAGDSGRDKEFWAAREEGSKSSTRFCLAPVSGLSESSGNRQFNNHTVHYWSINNTTSYFLRLPDGNLDGNGFAACHFQSLSKFRSGQIDAITAVDNSTTYHNWTELVTTMASIIEIETADIPGRFIQYQNPDTTINPKDHPDHIATGLAVQSMSVTTTLHQSLFVGYSVRSIEDELTVNDLFWKAGMFAAYEKAVYDLCGYSTLQEDPPLYVKWCSGPSKFVTILPVS